MELPQVAAFRYSGFWSKNTTTDMAGGSLVTRGNIQIISYELW